MPLLLCFVTIASIFFVTASSQDAGSIHCPVSYLVSASDVLSNVSVIHNPSTESLVEDIVSFRTTYCDVSIAAAGNVFTLKFSEQVLVNRIRVRGIELTFVSNFSLMIQENSTGTHNQFDEFLVDTSEDVVFAIPNRTAHSLQFRINSAVLEFFNNLNQFCWHIDVFGCRLTEAVPASIQLSTNMLDSMMSSSIHSVTPTVTVLPVSSCQNSSGNLAATVVPLAALIVVLLLVITTFIAVMAVISYRKRMPATRNNLMMKSVLQENSDNSANTSHREAIRSPDGDYASIPELGLDLATMKRGGNNEVILEMTDDFQIDTDSNPAYDSPKLPPKNDHRRSNSYTNGGSRLKRALTYGFRRDPAVEQSRDEENKRKTERESDLYI